MTEITLYGVQVSPYVRKVRLALHHKGVEYQHIPVVPVSDGNQPAEFVENSPLGKVPLLRVGDDYLPDSSVISAWLEREYPQPALMPEDNIAAAKVLWFEEYADSKMVPVIGGHLFAEVFLAPHVFKRPPIQEDIDAALNTEIPEIFDYLSGQLAGDYLLGDKLTLADIAVGSLLVTLHHCDYQCDAARWPKMASYTDRLLNNPLFAPLVAEEKDILESFKQ